MADNDQQQSADGLVGEIAPETKDTKLPDAAKRALAEAKARRQDEEKRKVEAAKEIDGRGGLDPARYGDWEKKGIAVDF